MKQFIEFIKEVRKTPRGRGILFFAFYFIVFAVLFVIIKINGNTEIKEKDYEPGIPYSFNTGLVNNNNYHFLYTITRDDTKYVYEGDRFENTELFTLNNKEYYFDGNKYYLDDKEVDNPYLYSDLLNINNINLLINSAMYDSKTDYRSGNIRYNFLLSSNTINSLINNKESDIDETPNSITVNSNKDGIVDEFIYHLDSYCKSDKSCKKSLEIDLSYEQFGEIKEIVNN